MEQHALVYKYNQRRSEPALPSCEGYKHTRGDYTAEIAYARDEIGTDRDEMRGRKCAEMEFDCGELAGDEDQDRNECESDFKECRWWQYASTIALRRRDHAYCWT